MKYAVMILCFMAIFPEGVAQTGKPVWTKGGHLSAVEHLYFDDNGKLLSSSGESFWPKYNYIENDVPVRGWNILTRNIEETYYGIDSELRIEGSRMFLKQVRTNGFSANNSYLAVLYGIQGYSADGPQVQNFLYNKIVFFDRTTGKSVDTNSFNSTTIKCIAIHPFETKIVVDARMYDFISGKPIISFSENNVILHKFSPDGKILAIATVSNGISLWNSQTGEFLKRLPSANTPTTITFSKNSEMFAVGDSTGNVFIWNINNETLAKEFKSNTTRINGLAFSDNVIYIGSSDSTVNVWSIESGMKVFDAAFPAKVTSVAISNADKKIAVGLENGMIEIVNPDLKNITRLTVFRPVSITSSISKDEATIFNLSKKFDNFSVDQKTAAIYEKNSGQLLKEITFDPGIKNVVISPDHTLLAINGVIRIGDKDSAVLKIINISDESTRFILTNNASDSEYLTAAFSPDSRLLAVTNNIDSSIQIWDLTDGSLKTKLHRIGYGWRRLAFSHDGQYLVGSDDELTTEGKWTFRNAIWRTSDFQQVQSISSGMFPIFSNNNKFLAMALTDSVIIWNLIENKPEFTVPFKYGGAYIGSFIFSPDSRYLVTFLDEILIWDISKKELFSELSDSKADYKFYAGSFSANGRYLATGGDILRLWDLNGVTSVKNETPLLKTTDLLKVFPNPSNGILTLQLDPFKNISGGEIRIFNSLGMLLKTVPAEFLKEMKIDCSGLSGGVYFVELSSEKGVLSRTSFIIAQ